MKNLYDEKPRSGLAILAAVLATAALLGLLLAPMGYKQGWWDYGYALQTVVKYSSLAAASGLFVGAMGLGHSWFGANRRGLPLSLLAIVVAVSALLTPLRQLVKFRTLPVIHDITTDVIKPPAFEASVAQRGRAGFNSTAYAGETLAAQQAYAYPDVQSLQLAREPEVVLPIAVELVKQRGWRLIATNVERGRVEAVDQSRWFGFEDDIVIRVRAENTGSRVDMRSSSRLGKSDLGVNAARIVEYLTALENAVK